MWMGENKRYVQFEFPYDDFAVKDNKTNEELWNPMIIDRLNEQDKEIKRLKCINRQLEERLDKSVVLDMSKCGDVDE